MKSLDTWLDEYGVSHQNKTNKIIHYFCVPLIFFSIVINFSSQPLTFQFKFMYFDLSDKPKLDAFFFTISRDFGDISKKEASELIKQIAHEINGTL